MDLKELKKLINEVKQERKVLSEQSNIEKVIHPEDVIFTLLSKFDSLPLEDDSSVKLAMSNIDSKMKLAAQRTSVMNKFVPHNAKELSMQELYSAIKNDPQIMNVLLNFLTSMGATESLISNFKNKAISELEQFNIKQPQTNPGTPAAISQHVSPTADTKVPRPISGLSESKTKAK